MFKNFFTKQTLQNTLEFVKTLRVEPFLFLCAFQCGLKSAPGKQLDEDKICSQWYDTTVQYCQQLPSSDDQGDGPGHFKSDVLANAALLGKQLAPFRKTIIANYFNQQGHITFT